MNKRPYQEINKPAPGSLRHTIAGAILVVVMGLALYFLLSILPAESPQINDQAPALEKLGVVK
ncbi:MAG: hypothetical protein U1D67_04255 [Dehalococcoidia bacterium]|nr:hypothetical protein [Dehalococcoidia bacterium]